MRRRGGQEPRGRRSLASGPLGDGARWAAHRWYAEARGARAASRAAAAPRAATARWGRRGRRRRICRTARRRRPRRGSAYRSAVRRMPLDRRSRGRPHASVRSALADSRDPAADHSRRRSRRARARSARARSRRTEPGPGPRAPPRPCAAAARPGRRSPRACCHTTCSNEASGRSASRRYDSDAPRRARAALEPAAALARLALALVPAPRRPRPAVLRRGRSPAATAMDAQHPASRRPLPGRSAAWGGRSEGRAFDRTPGRTSGAAGSRVRTSCRS